MLSVGVLKNDRVKGKERPVQSDYCDMCYSLIGELKELSLVHYDGFAAAVPGLGSRMQLPVGLPSGLLD